MSASALSIEDAPVSRLHCRVTAFTTSGMFCDGYMFGGIGIAPASAQTDLGMSSWWVGAVGAGLLIGIFFSGPVVGWLTDRIGRQHLFLLDLLVLLAASLVQLAAQDDCSGSARSSRCSR